MPAFSRSINWVLVRCFALRLDADLVLGADDLSQPMIIFRLDALFASRHSLVAGGQKLMRILFPGVERIPLFFRGKLSIFHDIAWMIEAIFGILDLFILWMIAHGKSPYICYLNRL